MYLFIGPSTLLTERYVWIWLNTARVVDDISYYLHVQQLPLSVEYIVAEIYVIIALDNIDLITVVCPTSEFQMTHLIVELKKEKKMI